MLHSPLQKLVVINYYASQSGQQAELDHRLHDFVASVKQYHGDADILLGGDFNRDIVKANALASNSNLTLSQPEDVGHVSRRQKGTKSSHIDHFAFSREATVIHACLDPGLSDHVPQCVNITQHKVL